MVALEQARHYLESLGLDRAAAVLDQRLEQAAHRQVSYAEFLADLLAVEATARRERYLKARTRLAHLPFHKTLEDFDFRFQPSIDERQVRELAELAELAFVREAANALFLGPPGVGNPHLAGSRPGRGPAPGHGRPPARSAAAGLPGAQAAHHRRVRHLALRPHGLNGLVHADFRPLRAGQHHLDLQQGFRRVGECWATRSSPRPSWTACCTTATSSTSEARATGFGRSARPACLGLGCCRSGR